MSETQFSNSETQFNNRLTDEVKVSPEALEQLSAIMASDEEIQGIRIFVSGGGCGGMSYGMTVADQTSELDCVLERDGVKIYIDAVALGFLEGVEIDLAGEGPNRSFVFRNVFAATGGSGTCGTCGAAGGGCS